jgi:hypothetical protein
MNFLILWNAIIVACLGLKASFCLFDMVVEYNLNFFILLVSLSFLIGNYPEFLFICADFISENLKPLG